MVKVRNRIYVVQSRKVALRILVNFVKKGGKSVELLSVTCGSKQYIIRQVPWKSIALQVIRDTKILGVI